MSLPILPPELIEQIIDQLHGAPLTLTCCALVCRAWLSRSRSHIFRRIILGPRETSRLFILFSRRRKPVLQILVDAIKASPEIASYIQEVEVVEGVGTHEWIANEPLLFLFLALAKNVTRFQLRHSATIPILWRTLSPEFKIALLQVLASPSLSEISLGMLSFTNGKVFRSLLQRSSHLQALHLDHIQITKLSNNHHEVPDKFIFKPTRRAPLDTLVLGARTSPAAIGCLVHPESTIDLTSLRNLSVSMSNSFEEFAHLLQSAFGLDQDDPLPWLNSLFSTFTAPNKLRKVDVVYSLYLPSPYMDRSMNTANFSTWQEIDATLSSPTFNSLEEVRLEFSLENPIGFGVAPRFLQEVNLPSPALRASHRLVVEAFDTSR
ncbi:hypothetical protein C0993_006422 [Termitomyces sp. T159_Od127]|nr:hypothetical protein C0993_006422 [Termitomyces sp. T159_Od127]